MSWTFEKKKSFKDSRKDERKVWQQVGKKKLRKVLSWTFEKKKEKGCMEWAKQVLCWRTKRFVFIVYYSW